MIKWVGITGGIGSGKSTVSQIFQSMGIMVIDTDKIAKELTESNAEAILPIGKIFGRDVLTLSGALDRNKMRQIIFEQPQRKQDLENILYPFIQKKIIEQQKSIDSDFPYAVVDIPLLYEKQEFRKFIDRVLVVDSSVDLQIERVKKRNNLSNQEIMSIIKQQASREERLSIADDVLINTGDLQKLKELVIHQHQQYLEYFGHAAEK